MGPNRHQNFADIYRRAPGAHRWPEKWDSKFCFFFFSTQYIIFIADKNSDFYKVKGEINTIKQALAHAWNTF